MQKQRSRTSTSRAGAALKCGAVALGAGLLSATALASAQADDSAVAGPQAAAQTVTQDAAAVPAQQDQQDQQAAIQATPQDVAQNAAAQETAPQDAALQDNAVQDNALQDATAQDEAPDALASIPGKVTAQSGLFVHSLPRLTAPHVGTLSYGANVSVWCDVTTDIRWYRVQVSPQHWAAANFISVPAGSKIPTCTSLGLSDGLGGDEGTEPAPGAGSGSSAYNGDSSSIGPIIVTNQFDNASATSSN